MNKSNEILEFISRQNSTTQQHINETNRLLKSIKNSLIYANVLILILLIFAVSLIFFSSPVKAETVWYCVEKSEVSIGSNHKPFAGSLKKYKMKVDSPLVSFSGEGLEDSIIHKDKRNSETQFRAVSRKYPWQILRFSDGLLVITHITFTNVGTVTTADCEKF